MKTAKDSIKKLGFVFPVKYIKGLGIMFPSKKEVVQNTLATVAVMLAGGAFLFIIDTAAMYLFAVSG